MNKHDHKHDHHDGKPAPSPAPGQNDKVILPDNIMALIDQIVKDINEVKAVVDDVHSGNYQKAVADLLQVIQNIVTDLILPKVLKQSAAHTGQ